MKVYIAGPMTGITDHNFPAFNAAEATLLALGHEVVNPARNFGGRVDLPRSTYMRADVVALAGCDAICVLDGWQYSNGARVEYLLATEMGFDVLDSSGKRLAYAPDAVARLSDDANPPEQAKESILAEAARLTSNDRQADYGHPREDFDRTALMWTGILRGKLQGDTEIEPEDIPLCMIAVKMARQAHHYKRDNLVDIAGYARTAAMVAGDE